MDREGIEFPGYSSQIIMELLLLMPQGDEKIITHANGLMIIIMTVVHVF